MLLDALGGALDLGQAGHGHEAEVADVGFADRDELAEELHGAVAELDGPGGTPANDEVDGLEEDGVVGVGLVDGVGNVGLGEDLGNDGGQLRHVGLGRATAIGGSVGAVGGDGVGVQLQELEELDLQPGAGGAVVQVLPGAGLLEDEHAQDVHYVRDESFVFVGVLSGQAVEEGHGRGQHPEVAVLQELGDVGGEFPAGHEVGTGPDEAEEAKGGLLPHARRGRLGQEDVLDLDVETLDELQSGDVGDGAEGQGLGDVGRGLVLLLGRGGEGGEVLLEGGQDGADGGISAPQQQAQGDVADLLLAMLGRPDQRQDLRVAEVDLVAQDVYVHELPNVLLPLVAGQGRVGSVGIELARAAGRELLADVRQLLLDALDLLVLGLGVAQVRDEILQSSCLGRHGCCLGSSGCLIGWRDTNK